MLKTFRGLALGLVVLVGSAYVTPTYASSTSVIITNIQPGAPKKAYEEHVLLYNTTSLPVDVTDWCLTNKSDKEFACFTVQSPEEAFIIQPNSYALIVSEYKSTNIYDKSKYSLVYEASSLTTSSIVASSDTISLLNHSGDVVDSVSWSKSIDSSLFYSRAFLDGVYLDTDAEGDWFASPTFTPPVLGAGVQTPSDHYDVCANIKGYQHFPPEGYISADGLCVEGDSGGLADSHYIRLSEVLANPSGPDAGKEYIELYNFGSNDALLSEYKLLIGKSLEKTIQLPDVYIGPGQYFAVYNNIYSFSLLNTTGKIALVRGSDIVDETSYTKPKDDMSWSLLEGAWQYTDQTTPNLENKPNLPVVEPKKISKPTLKPCASNQYRHPETNRCRLVSSSPAASTPKPCAANQFRNPETGRCKLLAASDSGPRPCKEGQERNPETNRCRNTKKMTTVDYEVLAAKTEVDEEKVLHVWMLGLVAGLGVVGYAVWEWRLEVVSIYKKLRSRFARQEK